MLQAVHPFPSIPEASTPYSDGFANASQQHPPVIPTGLTLDTTGETFPVPVLAVKQSAKRIRHTKMRIRVD